MRTCVLFMVWLLLPFAVFSQDERKIYYVEGEKYSYEVYKFYVKGSGTLVCYNNLADSLRLLDYEYPYFLPKPEFPDLKLIVAEVTKLIAEELKEKKVILDNSEEYVGVAPIADENGCVREVVLSVPERWNISLSVVDACQDVVRKGNYCMKYRIPVWHGKKIVKYHYPQPVFAKGFVNALKALN